MKRHAFWIFLSFLGLVLLLFSCEEQTDCEIPATVVELPEGCGLGFELSNGKLLKPVIVYGCFMPPDPLYSVQYVVGQKVLIGYVKSDADIACGKAKPITLTCLQTLDVIGY